MAKGDTVYSLFGMKTPQEVAAERVAQYNQLLKQQPSGFARTGMGFGMALRGLFGGPDTEMQKAQTLEEIRSEYQPGNIQNMAETYTRLKEAGAPAETLNRLSSDITTASQAFNERAQEQRARSKGLEYLQSTSPDLVPLYESQAMTLPEVLKAQREQQKLESDEAYREQQTLKIKKEIEKLNNPGTMTQKELFTLAKDFTPDSVKSAFENNDVSLLLPKDPAKSNYVVVNQTTGYDANGQPITKPFLIDKNQVGALTGDNPVVSLSDLGVTPSATAPTQDAETPTPDTTTEALPGIPGLSPEKNIEMREQAMAETMGAQLLVDDIFSPGFEEIAGAPQVGTRLAARFFDTPLAPMAQRMESGAITRAIQVAGDLGVNPTDKDFEVSLKAAPGPNDGPRAWRDWISKQYIPSLKTALASKYGSDNPRVIAIQQQLDESITQAQSTQFEEKTTSTGVKYKVKKR